MAAGTTFEEDLSLWQEQTRLFNFLKHYDLHQYYPKFVDSGVKRLSHLKDVVADEACLNEIGLTRPERIRLRKKVKENVESFGKFKNWILRKSTKFDDPVPEVGDPPVPDPSPSRSHSAAVIPKDQIKLGEKIGEGAHGSVHRGVWADIHGSVAVAIKRLFGRQEVQTQFIKEANSMCTLNHPNIIKLYGIVLSEPLMLIEELAPLGNLHSYLHKNGARLTLRIFHSYAIQIADAMRYLEKNRIVHRDLATRNLLLLQEDSVKLSDFGMARVLDEHSDVYNLSNLGAKIPVAWTAIESLTKAKFSTSSDVWSYGVVLWEIYSLGETPFEGLSPVEIRDMLLQGERLGRPERCPTGVYSVMGSCWSLDPQDRPSFAQLYQRIEAHPPTMVRAIQSHEVAEDPSYLSFKTGELIYVIDKPKPEWIFGMRADGTIGQLSSDLVTNIVAALDNIKAMVNSGRMKTAELSISDPTSVDHMMHWGRDGTKWQVTEQDASILGRRTPPPGSPVTKQPSPFNPKSTYLRLGIPRSPSPSGQQSHLLNSVAASTNSITMTTSDSPHHPTVSYTSSQVTEPDMGYEISYGDAHFMGKQRYVENGASYASDDTNTSPQHSSRDTMTTSTLGPSHQIQTQVSEDNSYVSISRINMPHDVVQSLSQIEVNSSPGHNNEPEDSEYIVMGSHSIPASHLCNRYPLQASGGAESSVSHRSTTRVNGTATSLHRGSLLDSDIPTTTTRLQDPLEPTSTTDDDVFVSQDTTASEEAITPGSVRFFNTAGTSPNLYRRRSSGVYESSHSSRPPVIPRRYSQKEPQHPHRVPYNHSPPMPNPRQTFSTSSDQAGGSFSIENTSPNLSPATVRVGIHGNPAFDIIRSDSEFSDTLSAVIRNTLQKHQNDPEKAKETLRVNKLLDMGIPNITEVDCVRALSHCQQKTDRAAGWLLEISNDIQERAQ